MELIKTLSDEGMSIKEISEFLNVNEIHPLRTTKPYSPKLVWGSLKKYEKRMDRYDSDLIIEKSETLCVTPFAKDNKPKM